MKKRAKKSKKKQEVFVLHLIISMLSLESSKPITKKNIDFKNLFKAVDKDV